MAVLTAGERMSLCSSESFAAKNIRNDRIHDLLDTIDAYEVIAARLADLHGNHGELDHDEDGPDSYENCAVCKTLAVYRALAEKGEPHA